MKHKTIKLISNSSTAYQIQLFTEANNNDYDNDIQKTHFSNLFIL